MGGAVDLIGGLLSPIQTLISGPKKAKAIPPPLPTVATTEPLSKVTPMPVPDDAAAKVAARRKLATGGGRRSTILSSSAVARIGTADKLGD